LNLSTFWNLVEKIREQFFCFVSAWWLLLRDNVQDQVPHFFFGVKTEIFSKSSDSRILWFS
jgi:hypothetical protein